MTSSLKLKIIIIIIVVTDRLNSIAIKNCTISKNIKNRSENDKDPKMTFQILWQCYLLTWYTNKKRCFFFYFTYFHFFFRFIFLFLFFYVLVKISIFVAELPFYLLFQFLYIIQLYWCNILCPKVSKWVWLSFEKKEDVMSMDISNYFSILSIE